MSQNKYAGTQTEKNLLAAFAGESQARNKYTYFASRAKKDGFEQISALFLKTAVLDLLKEDCRLPLEKIAVMTGAPLEEVASTIEDLEKRRIILRYAPMINWDLTDRERVEAMIEVRVTPQRDMGFDAIARRIYCFDEVKSVFLMSGSYDLLVLVEARTLKELAAFVSGKLSPLETVTGTATSFVLKRYKEEGVIFDNGETDRRLVISP